MKKGKRKGVPAVLGALSASLFLGLLFFVPQAVSAEGLVDGIGGGNAGYLYSTYPLENYNLDFYVDTSWGWLPWNWLDSAGRALNHALYAITNGLWHLSRLLSAATGSVVSEAYRFDLINEVADSIGENMQRLAGVSASGLSGDGFYPGFIMLILAVLGVYVAYVGLYKREVSRAVGAVVKTVVIFIMTTGLILYAPQGIRMINEFSSDVSAAALRLGTSVSMPGSGQGEGDSVELIRDSLFSIQVYQPWLLMQWGTTDVDEIGQDRVYGLLAASPDDAYGQTREELVKTEIETYGNMRMTLPKVLVRFGEVLFILFINLFISLFVILMCGLLVLTQILFIVYTLFLVVSAVVSMFPECGGVLRTSLVKVFNVMMLRAGYTLMITFAFTVSTMIYSVAGNHAFVTIGFLQIVTFAGIFFSKGDILKMMSLQGDSGINRTQAFGGLLAYSQMRRGSLTRRAAGKVKDKAKSYGKAGLGFAGEKAAAYGDRRAAQWHRERAAHRAAETDRMRREYDYTVAGQTPGADGASFRRRSDGSEVTSQNVYDRYFHDEKPKRYHAARSTPETAGAEFTTEEQRIVREKYVRPEKWAKAPTGKDVRRTYYKRRFDDKMADRITPDSVGAELRDTPHHYHAAGRSATPEPMKRELGKKIRTKRRDMRADTAVRQEVTPEKREGHNTVRSPGAGKKETPRRYHVAGRQETPKPVKREAEARQTPKPVTRETEVRQTPERRDMRTDTVRRQETARETVQETVTVEQEKSRRTPEPAHKTQDNLYKRRKGRDTEKSKPRTEEKTGGNGEKDWKP